MRHITVTTVLRNATGDYTNHGFSSVRARPVLVLDVPYKKVILSDGTSYYGEPDQVAIRQYCHKNTLDERNVLFLDERPGNDIYPPICRTLDEVFNPNSPGKKVGPMAGGNYLEFRDPEKGWNTFVYSIHDRYETQEEYDTLSQ